MYSAVLIAGSSEQVFRLVKKVENAEKIYNAITEAGLALASASQSAGNQELAEIGESVGNEAAAFITRNPELIQKQVVPIFSESLIAGEMLSQMCEEIGHPIILPESESEEGN